jgi:hypothetical protein
MSANPVSKYRLMSRVKTTVETILCPCALDVTTQKDINLFGFHLISKWHRSKPSIANTHRNQSANLTFWFKIYNLKTKLFKL